MDPHLDLHALDPHSLLRINGHEEAFLPVEVKVAWLSSQASMRSRASAMVGRRISQLDDAIRVRALLAIIRSAAPTAATAAAAAAAASASAAAATAGEDAAVAPPAEDQPGQEQDDSKRPAEQDNEMAPSDERGGGGGGGDGGVPAPPKLARFGSASGSRDADSPAPGADDLELFLRMAVSKIKEVLLQVASDDEKKERQGKDVFDIYEGHVTTDDLEKAAEAGFPSLDVETILLPKHFRYRALVAARHRFLVRQYSLSYVAEEA